MRFSGKTTILESDLNKMNENKVRKKQKKKHVQLMSFNKCSLLNAYIFSTVNRNGQYERVSVKWISKYCNPSVKLIYLLAEVDRIGHNSLQTDLLHTQNYKYKIAFT